MTPDRWRQIEELYHAAQADRAVLDTADPEIRHEVESLLGQDGTLPAALESSATLTMITAGSQLGPYQIEALLGHGGMGQVFRAMDTRLGRAVAIKTFHEKLNPRFEREARAISALNHPHICTLYDIGPNYLVMELVEGPTLAARLKAGGVAQKEALDIALQISEALDAAHARGIVHRDLKPANIIVKPDGSIKVLDFGLAKFGVAESGDPAHTFAPTRAGVVMGTPAYMAPEQAQGQTTEKQADVWAFGVIVYEMFTGSRLFSGASAAEILASVLTREPDWSRVPPQASRLLRRCLERDPKRRLRDIAEVPYLLEEVPVSQPVVTAPRQRPLPWILAGVFALIALGAFLWSYRAASATSDHPLIRLNVDLGPEAVKGALLEAAISPDGARVVFPAHSPDGQVRLAVRLLQGGQTTFLAGTENAAIPFFPPDGQSIGFMADGKFKKVPVEGGPVVVIANAPVAPFGVAWDGKNLFYSAGNVNPVVQVAPDGDGKRQPLTKVGERGDATHRWAQALPGGAVLFTSHRIITGFDDAHIEAVTLPGGDRKVLLRGGYFGRYKEINGRGYLLYVRDGALFATRFDLRSLTVQGTSVAVLDDIAGDWDLGAGQFDLSTNGTLIYRSGSGPMKKWPVLWMDSSGKTEPLLAEPGAYYTPRLSPDGKRLALTVDHGDKGREIAVYDLGRGSLTQLTFTGEISAFPIWSPDGKYILFETSSPKGYDIGLVRSDGAGGLLRLAQNNNLMIPYSFSADGKKLSYTHGGGSASIAPFDTSDPDHPQLGKAVYVTSGSSPMISPDGGWVAYTSLESARSEVYVQPLPGPGAKVQISINGNGAGGLAWAPEAHELFFLGPDNKIMVSSYTVEGKRFVAGRPRAWSDTPIGVASSFPRQFSIAPDGKRFAVFPPLKEPIPGSVHITFVLNFGYELQRLIK